MNSIRRFLIFICILGCLASAALWYWPTIQAANKEPEKRYNLSAYTKEQDNFDKMTAIVEEMGYTPEVGQVQRHVSKSVGYIVVFKMNDKEFLDDMVKTLKSRNVPAKIRVDEDTGDMFLLAGSNFNNQQQAEKFAEKAREATYGTVAFKVTENMKKFPYTAHSLTIKMIETREKADEISEALTELVTEDVVIEEIILEEDENGKPVTPREDEEPGLNGDSPDTTDVDSPAGEDSN